MKGKLDTPEMDKVLEEMNAPVEKWVRDEKEGDTSTARAVVLIFLEDTKDTLATRVALEGRADVMVRGLAHLMSDESTGAVRDIFGKAEALRDLEASVAEIQKLKEKLKEKLGIKEEDEDGND